MLEGFVPLKEHYLQCVFVILFVSIDLSTAAKFALGFFFCPNPCSAGRNSLKNGLPSTNNKSLKSLTFPG